MVYYTIDKKNLPYLSQKNSFVYLQIFRSFVEFISSFKKVEYSIIGDYMNYLDVIEVLSRMEEKMNYIKLVTYTRKYKNSCIDEEVEHELSEFDHCA